MVTKMAKTVTNILKFSPTHFVSDIDVATFLIHLYNFYQFFLDQMMDKIPFASIFIPAVGGIQAKWPSGHPRDTHVTHPIWMGFYKNVFFFEIVLEDLK